MSLEKIELPAPLIISLYKNSLYAMEKEGLQVQPEMDLPAALKLPVLGNNRLQVTLLVSFANDAFLPDRHLEFIAKMLGALKMNLGDVAIVNNRDGQYRYNEITEQLQPLVFIFFGITTSEIGLPMEFPDFTIQHYNGCQLLLTPSLDMLNQEVETAIPLKKKLWGCLKQLFPAS